MEVEKDVQLTQAESDEEGLGKTALELNPGPVTGMPVH